MTMKVMSNELLEGAALDAEVALAEGLKPFIIGSYMESGTTYWTTAPPPYSTEWKVGGPIIERERIMLKPFVSRWEAFAVGPDRIAERLSDGASSGPTPLIAAMRAYVAAKEKP